MTQYAIKKLGTSEVDSFVAAEGDDAPAIDGFDVEAISTPVVGWPEAPFEGAVLIVTAGVLGWRDIRTIEEARASAIDAIDTIADQARAKVLVKNTNSIEYQAALADAIKYRDAGFKGVAGRGVTSWSYAKRRQGWTNQQAAENILSTADAWENALYFIREQRLDAKELVRDTTTNSEVDTLRATFIATLTAAMQGIS